jgi:hypothetical protein
MKRSKKKGRKKGLTPSSIIGMVIGFGLIVLGLYQAFAYGKPGAYFVIFLGSVLVAIIIWFYKS